MPMDTDPVTEPPTEIQIDDPQEPESAETPYGSLFVPLVVVPALIVMVLVLVFVLFGAITGDELTPRENLQRMLHGGANQRDQAAFSLVRQSIEDWRAREEGREPEWGLDAGFLPDVSAAWELVDEDDYTRRYVLAILMSQLGDPEGGERLVEILEATAAEESGGEMPVLALEALASLGDDGTADVIIRFLKHPDPLLVRGAASALQNLPGEASREALRDLLGRGDLDLRGMAAISLSHLGDPAGADVLLELLDQGSYTRERELSPERWTSGENVSHSRRLAVEALARLGRPEDEALLREIADGDDDPTVREVALRVLSDRESGSAELR